MTKERVESIRKIVLPFIAKKLKEIDYEGLGESDAKEFTNDFNEILKLAEDAIEQDCISRQAVKDLMRSLTRWCVRSEDGRFNNVGLLYDDVMFGIDRLPSGSSSEKPNKWIPIKTRPLTNKEKEEYADLGYSEDSIDSMYDCPLPNDGEEVLITTRYDEVTTDTFYRDEGCYFETYCDKDDVKAWMQLPKPYKAEGSGKE